MGWHEKRQSRVALPFQKYLFVVFCNLSGYLLSVRTLTAAARILFLARYHHARKNSQCQNVGDNHQVVEHIRHFPNKIVGENRTKEYECNSDYTVNNGRLLAEEMLEVDLAEVVPAKDRGECEEEQANCNKDAAEDRICTSVTECHRNALLCHVRLVDTEQAYHIGNGEGVASCLVDLDQVADGAVAGEQRRDYDHGGHGKHNEGINEHTDHSGRALRVRILYVSKCMCVGAVANEACDNGRISVNGRVVKASYDVKVGDKIEISMGTRTVAVEVLQVAENVRKDDASAMYKEV